MTRDTFAAWTMLVSAVIAMVGTTMFYDHDLGMSYPIFFALIVAAVLGSGMYGQRPMRWRNLWPIAPALFFALMFAVRADDWLVFYNSTISLVLAALALHYMALKTPLDKTSTTEQIIALLSTGTRSALEGQFVTLGYTVRWFNNRSSEDGKRIVAVVRGLLITLPVLLVFGLLLGSADLIFGQYVQRLQNLFNIENADELFARVILTGFLMWGVIGVITYGLARIWQDTSEDDTPSTDTPAQSEDEPLKRGNAPLFRLSMIEGGMLLGSVNLLFVAFVGVQFVYLFGGQQNITLDGFTYAEYARRGFFELVAVSVLTMALLLAADRFTVRDGKGENRLFRVLALVMIGLVGVMLLSAARRMGLYTDAFGLTRLRLWVNVFMGWLGVLFGVLVLQLLRVRKNVFSFGLILVGVGFFVTMNLMNPDARIAAHNIDRALTGELEWDTCYLSYLSADAMPVMVDRYNESKDPTLGVLLHQLYTTRTRTYFGYDDSFFALNLGKADAHEAMMSVQNEVTEYDISDNLYPCYGYYGYDVYDTNRYE